MATTYTEREVVLVPPSDHAPRVVSRDPADFPPPTGREEEWRFTPLATFARLLSDEPTTGRLTLTSSLPEGVTVDDVSADAPLLGALPLPVDRLAALAAAGSGGAVRIRVAEGTAGSTPILLGWRGDSGGDAARGLVVLDVGAQARVSVVLTYTGSAAYAEQLCVLVGDGAAVEVVTLREWDDDAVNSSHVAVRLGRDATLRSLQVTLGGAAVRVVETVEYEAPGGDAELLGLFFADAGQHFEHRLFVDHAVPHCRSNVAYKGALQGQGARSVWVGDVLIRAAAVGTDTYEINRNLLLTDGARADSVPNLEIETGEVRSAGHASATGRFDDEQLFYLMSRGVPADEARRLVVRGFFAELLARVGPPEVRDRILTAVEAELGVGDDRFRFDDGEES
jgi:Fe-S cluster assembly protein SufD